MIKRLKILAAETEVNVNDILEDAIETFLKNYKKDPKKQS
ncbi:MAG: ribbon-helix-helix domain-containing protein [Desulfobacterales bacterium]|nr:ribbon-helix-helix domain-containing protein [Desulfobacterales bacterium]